MSASQRIDDISHYAVFAETDSPVATLLAENKLHFFVMLVLCFRIRDAANAGICGEGNGHEPKTGIIQN